MRVGLLASGGRLRNLRLGIPTPTISPFPFNVILKHNARSSPLWRLRPRGTFLCGSSLAGAGVGVHVHHSFSHLCCCFGSCPGSPLLGTRLCSCRGLSVLTHGLDLLFRMRKGCACFFVSRFGLAQL